MPPTTPEDPRIGHGFDVHRLDALAPAGRGRPLVLGGVRIEHDRGPIAHSDGDALLHAIADAVLGAAGLDDLGTLFPDSNPKWSGADSAEFVREAVRLARARGWRVASVDATVVFERPRIAPHRAAIRASVASLLGVAVERVGVKGKSREGVDAVGEGRAIEVHAVALLVRAPQARAEG